MGSFIFLYHPISQIQLSIEPEETSVAYNFLANSQRRETQQFFQEVLFVGAGFRTGNISIDGRYNVLHTDTNIYGTAFLPFFRIYF